MDSLNRCFWVVPPQIWHLTLRVIMKTDLFLAQIEWVVLNYTPLGVCHLHLPGWHEHIFISISELNGIALDQQTQSSMMQVCGRYNELDQAVCKICNVVVKSEVLWNPHLASRAHKEVIFLNCFSTSYPSLVLTQDIQEPNFFNAHYCSWALVTIIFFPFFILKKG